MALMAAGVPLKAQVAGISCGLVTGDTDDDFVLLTDIQGLEDFFGDMDFKVTGTHKGITAIQMDIKIHGLTPDIIREALTRTREARLYIMDEVMAPVIAEPRTEVSKYAPKICQIIIDPEKMGYETCAYIGLNLRTPESFDKVVEKLREMPEVVECHYTTGNYDLFIKIYAMNNHHLLNIIHDKLQPLGLARSESIISFHAAIDRTLPVMDLVNEND
jgi:hypothetical protein